MAKLAYFTGHPKRLHAIGVAGGGEYTVCGMAFDIASEEPDLGALMTVSGRGRVSCDECAAIIEQYRVFRVAPPSERVSEQDRERGDEDE